MATPTENSLSHGVTADLYRAAIGPRAQDYYLRHFLRFDAQGHTSATWHWGAYWSTLNWLIFRKMWGWALAYVAAVVGMALLIFGVGKLTFNYSDATGLMLFLSFLTAAFVLPGLYGNAWFYSVCQQRIAAALRDTEEVEQASALLAREASSSRRWLGLVTTNLALVALVAGVVTSSQDNAASALMLALKASKPPASQAREAAMPLSSGLLAAALKPNITPIASSEAANAPPVFEKVSDHAPADKGVDKAQDKPGPQASGRVTEQPLTPTPPPQTTPVVSPVATPATTPVSPEPAKPPVDRPAPAAAVKPDPVAPALATPTPAQKASPAAATKAEAPVTSSTPRKHAKPAAAKAAAPKPVAAEAQASAAPAVSGSKPKHLWFVQVGAFAQESNAQNARMKVEAAGLASVAAASDTPAGRLIRVRAGPFEDKAAAEKAALQIKAIDLPAVLVRE